ncbi:MAG: TetR/AcrR family transcriptional regulator [Rhodospirillaceae bacterium]|nr:TetR/AcrR family transcriptional regulator [Rhodospirillaceae bacterium]
MSGCAWTKLGTPANYRRFNGAGAEGVARAKRVRRTQEQRSEETKGKLIRATIALLIERGYARLTVADIARRAGVSNGARVHHFRTKEAIVVAANRQAYESAVALGTQRAQHPAHSKNPVRDCFDDLISLYFGDFFLGSLDSVVAARTDGRLAKQLHPVVARYHAAIRAAWTEALRAAGYARRDADDIYELVLGTVRGMALTSVRMLSPKPDLRLVRMVERMIANTYARSKA